jgi:hypothetical protein
MVLLLYAIILESEGMIMNEQFRKLLDHLQASHPGATIQYFDASEGIPLSAFNFLDEPLYPPKTVYKIFSPTSNEQSEGNDERLPS